ncbi:MAG: sugar phosphate isomerase/epimerase [Gammaproteobacteria bacterium]|nr:sugar phosphate isomerase/epimerase [Gammaproteobacteria bacterium]MDH4314638.1 sugar phosphate isomerase/epimerase [Gammaproteobacteria bacterium]MDH5212874.1 sugar phosphate isomerase/epimerase [Gammaproteobacteria bacterium]MDH5500697.1 sugar phosphate isomerase/epimerase [Gammaproteobacteria bacterium]
MQTLEIYQSLWGMELRHPELPERSVDENFRMVAEAGFDGMCIDLGVDEIEQFSDKKAYFEKYSLGCMVNAFPHRVRDLEPLLHMANEFDACMVNVIGGVMPITVEGALPVINRWMDDAARIGMPLLFETHRDGLLNDLFYTLQVIDSIPEMRLCADLSHFVVDREFRSPIPARDEAYIRRVLDRSDCFQGRIASREQIQVQIDFPQHQEWVAIFQRWWTDGMRMWRKRNADDATLVFLCELGPPPYAITDGKRHELSDRWRESLQIRQWVQDIWASLEAEDAASQRAGA